ncbi:MAG: TetR/AcrR family transcriptional regulator [Lysobacter sp.]
MEAATEAFATLGYRNTLIEQLCAAAGISARNFYEEFSGKEEILYALFDEISERARQAVVAAVDAADPESFQARMLAAVTAYLQMVTADARLSRIIHIESIGVSVEMEKHRQVVLTEFASIIEREANRMAALGLAPKRDYSLTVIGLIGAVRAMAVAAATASKNAEDLERVAAELAHIMAVSVLQLPTSKAADAKPRRSRS